MASSTIGLGVGLEHGFDQLVAHNNGAQYQGEMNYAPSGQSTSYASPAPSNTFENGFHTPPQQGYGPPFGSAGYATSTSNLPYGGYVQSAQVSPPTPASDLSDGRKTKENPVLKPNTVGGIRKRAPRATPKPKDAGERGPRNDDGQGGQLLKMTLSESAEAGNFPLNDMEAHIKRSATIRHAEAAKKNKKNDPNWTPRPMNSFMLYRSKFKDVAKDIFNTTNHQTVSQLVAISWHMEPEAVREEFKDLASREREEHLKCFPGYKFNPRTPGKGRSRRGKSIEQEDEDFSNVDEEETFDPTFTPSLRNSSKRSTRRRGQASEMSGERATHLRQQWMSQQDQSQAPSVYAYGMPLSDPLANGGIYEQGYQPYSTPAFQRSMMSTPQPGYGTPFGNTAPVAMPGGNNFGLMPNEFVGHLDPNLMNFNGTSMGSQAPEGTFSSQAFHDFHREQAASHMQQYPNFESAPETGVAQAPISPRYADGLLGMRIGENVTMGELPEAEREELFEAIARYGILPGHEHGSYHQDGMEGDA